VINRVDYTNTILPPDPNELGWKETINTYPFTDLIVAFKAETMLLPFALPQSNRLLDTTTPQGSTLNFLPVAPAPGAPAAAGVSNVTTNFGWEYVWHCHLLGHEENDMMRPLVVSAGVGGIFASVGTFQSGTWRINKTGNPVYSFGLPGDIPIVGDWTGTGTVKIGVFRVVGGVGRFYLDMNGNGVWDGPGVDSAINFGMTGDLPVVGDWNGTGRTKVGVFRVVGGVGRFYLDTNGNGIWEPALDTLVLNYGATGDIPVSGDWSGNGSTKIGVFRVVAGVGNWYLDRNGDGVFNNAGDTFYNNFGVTGDLPVVADWSGTGTTKVGVFRLVGGAGRFFTDANGNGVYLNPPDVLVNFGITGDRPVAGFF
jgi:hypothetical protein